MSCRVLRLTVGKFLFQVSQESRSGACNSEHCPITVLSEYNQGVVDGLVHEGVFVVIPGESLTPYKCAIDGDCMGALLVWQTYTIWGRAGSLAVHSSWRHGCPDAIHDEQHASARHPAFTSRNRSLARAFWGCFHRQATQ